MMTITAMVALPRIMAAMLVNWFCDCGCSSDQVGLSGNFRYLFGILQGDEAERARKQNTLLVGVIESKDDFRPKNTENLVEFGTKAP